MRLARSIVVLLLVLIGVASAQPPPPPTGVFSPTQPVTSLPLTVTKSGTGTGTVSGPAIDCGSTCATSYVQGVTTILFATPASGSVFTGWSGACTGTGSCSVSMSAPAVVTATFTGGAFTTYNLAWNDNSSDETNFSLERRTPCSTGIFAPLASPIANATTYSDTTALTGTQYEYRIDAVNNGGASAYSNLLCTPSGDPPGTITADTCSQADVQTAFNSIQPTTPRVRIPVGDCIWSTQLTLSPSGVVDFTVIGAGIGQTIIRDGRTRGSSGGPGNILTVNVPGGTSVFRLTGFTFNNNDPTFQDATADGTIILSGCSATTANYRIDHNRFNQLINVSLRFHGSLYGVTDNNIFIRAGSSNTTINTANESWPRNGVTCTGSHSDGSWAFPLPLDGNGAGTIRAHYIETNTFSNAPDGPPTTSSLDSSLGSRVVFRHNTLSWGTASSHGTDSGGRDRGQRWMEVYENDFAYPGGVLPGADSTVWIRGGSGVVANNRITMPVGMAYNWVVKHLNLRSDDTNVPPRSFAPWLSTAHPGVFPDCDGTAPWDGNTGVPQQPGGGYRCLDQPGAGTSVDFNDVEPPPNIPAQNTLEPIYVWNTTINGVVDNCGSVFGCDSDGVVATGVDIKFGPARPGWAPFTYPHPLTLVP